MGKALPTPGKPHEPRTVLPVNHTFLLDRAGFPGVDSRLTLEIF